MFGNSYCYLDFKGRQAVSFSDFKKGLDGLCVKMPAKDARIVFEYLTDSKDQDDSDSVFLTHDQFMKIKDEHLKRKVDPFELQVF